MFQVADNGIGIPKEKIRDAFNLFDQVDESIGKKYGGSGIGLSITKKVIDLMNGHIEITSDTGQGTTVRIGIPVQVLNPSPEKHDEGEEVLVEADDGEIMIKKWIDNLNNKKLTVILYDAIKKIPEKINQIEKCLRENNRDDLRFYIHKLKGFSGSFHLDEIFVLSGEMYEELKKEECDFVKIREKLAGIQEIVKIIPVSYLQKNDAYIPAGSRKMKVHNENARILIAEDSSDSQKLIGEILGKVDIKCNFADNGKSALDMLKRQKYDVLLLDVFMPVMDGFETIRSIRSDDRLKGLFVIAMTADNEESGKLRLLQAGCDDCLYKPVEQYELISKILSRLE